MRKTRGAVRHGADPPDPTRPRGSDGRGPLGQALLHDAWTSIRSTRVEWELRDARIGHGDKVSFEQRDVEFPRSWSQNATNIVAQKYFRGQLGSPARERSVKQMIGRVAGTIAGWGRERGYFATDEDADTFEAELTHILLHQMAAFNSPVWFNVGFEESPQCSGVLHPERRGHDGVDPRVEHQGGDDLPRRLGLGDQPVEDPRLDGAAGQGRHRLGSGELHARRRRLGRHDQVRRQDAARRQDGRARRRSPRHPRVHLVQGQGGGEGRRAARRRLRHVDRRRRLLLDPVPERQQLGPRHRAVHARGRERRGVAADRSRDRHADRRADPGASADARDRRGGVALRRSGRPVRHDDQPVAHVPELGPDQRVQPVQRVHARRRLGLQPGVAEPHEVPPRRRHVRRRVVRARGRHHVPRAGDHRLAVELSDRADRRQRARVPPARARLRQPRRLPDGQRRAVRLRRRPRDGRGDHGADDRPRVSRLGPDRRGDRTVRPLRREPRGRTTR